MVWRNGRGDIRARGADELHGIGGGDMFQHHTQGRETCCDWRQVSINEDLFPIENVDITISDLAVNQ